MRYNANEFVPKEVAGMVSAYLVMRRKSACLPAVNPTCV